MVQSLNYHMPTRIIFGPGRMLEAGKEAKAMGKKAFLVTGRKAMKKLGVTDRLIDNLKSSGLDVTLFDKTEPNPSKETVHEGAELLKKEKADLVIGLGGGSALDAAKAIAVIASSGGDIWDYVGMDKITNPVLPIIAIPTTAGTGSEVTHIAVVSDKRNKLKDAVVSHHIFPQVALVDPELMIYMPQYVTASTGIDVLAHAIETYTSNFAQPISGTLALRAIELCSRNLPIASLKEKDIEARANMALASTLAGMAIAQSDTTVAHIIGEALGAFFNVDHGVAVGILLPYVMEYNLCTNLQKFAEIAHAMGERIESLMLREAALKSVDAAKCLLTDINLPLRLRDIGIKEDLITEMTDYVMRPGATATNPRIVSREDVLRIFKEAF